MWEPIVTFDCRYGGFIYEFKRNILMPRIQEAISIWGFSGTLV